MIFLWNLKTISLRTEIYEPRYIRPLAKVMIWLEAQAQCYR
jgi:hypothetical protein